MFFGVSCGMFDASSVTCEETPLPFSIFDINGTEILSVRQFWVWGLNRPNMAERGPKWPKMAWMSVKMTEIDWFDDVTALTDQFWVPVLTSSCSEAGPKFWHREIFLMESRHFEWSHDQFTTILSLGPKSSEIGLKWPQMSAIDWFDGVTALTDQFLVPVLTSSCSDAGLAKNLNFGTVNFFDGATDHNSSFSFTQNTKFLRPRAKSEDILFFF